MAVGAGISRRVDSRGTIARTPHRLAFALGVGRAEVTTRTRKGAPWVDAFQKTAAVSLEAAVLAPRDHAFSALRIALAQRVTEWLQTVCAEAD